MYLCVEIASSDNSFYYCYAYFHCLFVKHGRLHIEEEVFVSNIPTNGLSVFDVIFLKIIV